MLHFLRYHLKLVEQIFLGIIVACIAYCLYVGNAWGILYLIVLAAFILQLARYRFVRDVWRDLAETDHALNGKLLEELAVLQKASQNKAKPKAKKGTKANGTQVEPTSKPRATRAKAGTNEPKANRPSSVRARKSRPAKKNSKA